MDVFRRLWRIPNKVLESEGRYLGRPDRAVERAFRIRSLVAVLVLLVVPLIWPAYGRNLPGLLQGPTSQGGYTAFNVLATLMFGLIVSAAAIVAFLIVFSLVLFLVTRSGARAAMARQLRWPLLSLGFLVLWFGGTTLVIDLLGPPVQQAVAQAPEVVRVLWIGVKYVVGAYVLAWTLKVIYLAARDVCRADDGHPALAPLVTTAAVWTIAVITVVSLGVSTDVPRPLALGLAWGGPIGITLFNLWACWRIWKHKHHLLFRDGPSSAWIV